MKLAFGIALGAAVGMFAAMVATHAGGSSVQTAEAQAGPGAGAGANGTLILGTGGGTANQNDLCWVLSKVKPAKGPERTVLALYRAERNGAVFELQDVRMIDADLRVIELKKKLHAADYQVENILKELPKEERESIVPPK
jgi:hypothetical protein